MNIQSITNVSDCVPLYLPHSLYLKPLAKFYISVSLPAKKLDKTISNIDIMEKLREAIKPDKYLVLKVSKTMLDFIRFEAELEDRSKLKNVVARLDGRSIKLSGYSELFRVRAKDAKDEFPSRHDWDSFFRDAKNMDEMKAGERPDTVHISNLPIRWFCPRHMENDQNVKPSENIFKRIFEKFGSVRCVDIPICDPYRPQMKTEITGMKTFNFDQEVLFEGYVQFSEYVGFVRAMDEFRGMKLVRRLGDKNQAVNINVNFDKTKHLSDASIKRRNIVRERLIVKERAKEEEETKKKREEQERLELERKKQEELRLKELEKQREREEKRKEKHLKKLREKGQLEIDNKIRREEKKLLIAQRKLESIRLLEALFERIKLKEANNIKKNVREKQQKKKLGNNDLRNKLIEKYKTTQEEVLIKQKTKLEQVKGKTGLLLLLDPNKKGRSPSVNTISSDDSVLSDSHQNSNSKKKKSKKKKKHGNNSSSSSGSNSSSLSEEEENQKAKAEKTKALNPFAGMYPPEMTAEWLQMGMYPYPPTLFAGVPPIRPGFFPNAMNYRGGYRGRFPRIRGRGRGRGNPFASNAGMYPYDSDLYYKYFKKTAGTGNDEDYDDNYDVYDRKRSKTYSRSKSRSRSRSHSHSRSRRRSKTRRSRSRRTRSDSRSRSRSHTRGRRSRSRFRSRSRSRSKTHSRTRTRSHKRSHSRSSSKSRTKTKLVSTRRSCPPTSDSSHSRSRSRSWSRNHRSSSRKIDLKTDELVRSAKEIQQKVQNQIQEKSEKRKSQHSASTSRKRSSSIDSSKFKSPKRKEKSWTPDWKTNSVK